MIKKDNKEILSMISNISIKNPVTDQIIIFTALSDISFHFKTSELKCLSNFIFFLFSRH